LITAIACHRRAGNLKDIGIPPTTHRGNKGLYAVINIFFFRDPGWASVDKLARWFKVDNYSKMLLTAQEKTTLEKYFLKVAPVIYLKKLLITYARYQKLGY